MGSSASTASKMSQQRRRSSSQPKVPTSASLSSCLSSRPSPLVSQREPRLAVRAQVRRRRDRVGPCGEIRERALERRASSSAALEAARANGAGRGGGGRGARKRRARLLIVAAILLVRR